MSTHKAPPPTREYTTAQLDQMHEAIERIAPMATDDMRMTLSLMVEAIGRELQRRRHALD